MFEVRTRWRTGHRASEVSVQSVAEDIPDERLTLESIDAENRCRIGLFNGPVWSDSIYGDAQQSVADSTRIWRTKVG